MAMVGGRLQVGAARALLQQVKRGSCSTILPVAAVPAVPTGIQAAKAVPGVRRTFLNLAGMLGATGSGGGNPDGKKFEESTILPYGAHARISS